MASPKDRSLKDTGFFGIELNLGNYTDPSLLASIIRVLVNLSIDSGSLVSEALREP
jgi:hypothetical protein